jgi:hypothetical protein
VGAQHAELTNAVHLVLVELLTVLGHLTDEILTPALHDGSITEREMCSSLR